MVRHYQRKTSRGAGPTTYSTDDLERALQDVKNGNKTTKGAAEHYGIPRSTLKHYVHGTRGKGKQTIHGQGGGGVVSYLSPKEEQEIANCLIIMDKNGYGLSRAEVLDLVGNYIACNNLKTRFKNNRPGNDWFTGFKRRHGLTLKRAQSIEHIRADQTSPWVIYKYFELLCKTMTELNLIGKPSQIYNCDETAFCHDPSKTKVVSLVGSKCQRKTSSSGRENTTVLMCGAADGKMLPPLCVFKGKFVMENWIGEEVTQTAISVSERGWMDSALFLSWFRKIFIPSIGEQRPVLLIYDGHVSHVSLDLIKLAKENSVTIMKLPPHTTHVLQPLDVSVFKSMKTKWDKELCAWQRQNPRKKIPKSEFVSIINRIVQDDIQKENLISGFSSTGIYDPIIKGPNKEKIPVTVFKPGHLQQYRAEQNLAQMDVIPINEPQRNPSMITEHQSDDHDTNIPANLTNPSTSQLTQSDEAINQSDEHDTNIPANLMNPSTSQLTQSDEHDTNVPANLMNPSTSQLNQSDEAVNQSDEHDSDVPPSTSQSHQGEQRKSFEQLVLEFVTNSKPSSTTGKKRKRVFTDGEIITSQEFIQMKEKEQNEKAEKEKIKQEKVKERNIKKEKAIQKSSRKKNSLPIPSSDSEDSESVPVMDESFEFIFSEEEEDDGSGIVPGDYCIVRVFGKTPKSFRLYAAKIESVIAGGFTGTYLKRHNQTMKFLVTDESSFFIKSSDIVRKLSRPVDLSSTRYKDMITFSTDLSDLTNIF